MKLEPTYFREKTVEHYGKRGMSWHGALVRYWMYDEDSGEAVETKHYFDQICNGDNKQDKEATAALVEALLLSLRRDVPHVTRLTFQSDNASNYQNAYLGLMLPILGAVHGYYVMRYVHSDTQDGKSMLDAHFATASRKVKSWVRQGNDCATPAKVVEALTADGGLPNCIAELIEQDRAHGAELSQQVRPLEKSLSKIIDRANDIFYDFPLPLAPLESGFDLKKVPSYRMKVFAYSGVGEGTDIIVDPSGGRCSVACEPASGVGVVEDDGASVVAASAGPGHGRAGTVAHQRQNQESNDNIQRRLHFDCDEVVGDSRVCDGVQRDSGQNDCDGDEDVSDFEVEDEYLLDDDSDLSAGEDDSAVVGEAVVLPHEATGIMTGIRIKTSAQIRRRTRVMSSLTPVQAQDTSVTEENVTENDVEAYAKRKLLKLNIGGDFGDFAARGELSSKMLTIYPSANAIAPPVTARMASNEAVSSAANNPSSLSEAPATRLEAAVHASKTVPTDADAFESDLDDGSEKSDNEFVLPDADSSEQDFGEHIAPSAGGTCLADGRDGSSAISVNPLKMGWARRPKRGEMYGTKYVALYEKEIEAMFQQGEKDQSQKMGPARMLEALILANPHRYNLPGENEIRGFITKLMKRRRQPTSQLAQQPQLRAEREALELPEISTSERSSNSSGDTERSDPQQHLGQKKKKMVPAYANFLAGLVKDDPRIMPRHALAMLYHQFPDARGKADEKRVRDKVSDLKRKPKIRRSRVSSPTSTPSS